MLNINIQIQELQIEQFLHSFFLPKVLLQSLAIIIKTKYTVSNRNRINLSPFTLTPTRDFIFTGIINIICLLVMSRLIFNYGAYPPPRFCSKRFCFFIHHFLVTFVVVNDSFLMKDILEIDLILF